jgi:two-component system, chemotaxis family, sensor kinase CheA
VLARRAGIVTTQKLRNEQAETGLSKQKLTLLLLGGSDGERMAMPLDRVQRLEEFDAASKEPLAGQFVMQYRGEILPVVELTDLLDERRAKKRTAEGLNPPLSTGKISAIVVKNEHQEGVILQVHRILGIVKVEFEKLNAPSRAGVRGTLVVQERVTELLDLQELLAKIPSGVPVETLSEPAGGAIAYGN